MSKTRKEKAGGGIIGVADDGEGDSDDNERTNCFRLLQVVIWRLGVHKGCLISYAAREIQLRGGGPDQFKVIRFDALQSRSSGKGGRPLFVS
jgi:hypothetical protein